MKSRKEIFEIVTAITRRDRGIPDRRVMHPKREWSIIVIVWLLIVVMGTFYGVYMFQANSSISIETEMVEVKQKRYERAVALEALERYEARAEAYNNVLQRQTEFIPEPQPELVEVEEVVSDSGEGAETDDNENIPEEVVSDTETDAPDEISSSTPTIDELQ